MEICINKRYTRLRAVMDVCVKMFENICIILWNTWNRGWLDQIFISLELTKHWMCFSDIFHIFEYAVRVPHSLSFNRSTILWRRTTFRSLQWSQYIKSISIASAPVYVVVCISLTHINEHSNQKRAQTHPKNTGTI